MALTIDDADLDDIDETLGWLSGLSHRDWSHAQPGDVVIDLDELAAALGHEVDPHRHPAYVRSIAQAARRAAIDETVAQARLHDLTAWIIDSTATPERLAWWQAEGAEVVRLDPGIDVCAARAAARPSATLEQIRRWYARHA